MSSVWILLGLFHIFNEIYDIVKNSIHSVSFYFIISNIISLFFIVIGINFLFKKSWAFKAIFVSSLAVISGALVLCTEMVIYGIFDIIRFQTLGACLRLVFGIIIFFSSIPFILMIANFKMIIRTQNRV